MPSLISTLSDHIDRPSPGWSTTNWTLQVFQQHNRCCYNHVQSTCWWSSSLSFPLSQHYRFLKLMFQNLMESQFGTRHSEMCSEAALHVHYHGLISNACRLQLLHGLTAWNANSKNNIYLEEIYLDKVQLNTFKDFNWFWNNFWWDGNSFPPSVQFQDIHTLRSEERDTHLDN